MAANTNGGKPRHDEDNISIIELDSVTVSTKQDILTEEKNQSIILQKYYFIINTISGAILHCIHILCYHIIRNIQMRYFF